MLLAPNQTTAKLSVELSNSDLYTGYNEYDPLLDSKAVLRSAYGERRATGARTSGTGLVSSNRKSRLGRRTTLNFLQSSTAASNSTGIASSTIANNATRPVTAARAAGYTRNSLTTTGYRQDSLVYGSMFDPLGQQRLTSSSQKQDEKLIGISKTKSLQLKVEQLYQESVLAAQRCDFTLALKKARDCVSRERNLQKHLNTLPLSDSSDPIWSSLETSLTVQVNLSIQLTRNKLYQDAIEIYQSILKNQQLYSTKQHPKPYAPGRFKCNIGSIYYAEGKYTKAIMYYSMASDQMPIELQDLKIKINRNIAFCFVRMGKYGDALRSFEYNLSERALFIDAFRLLVCNYAIKDVTGMKTAFLKLLELRGYLYEHSSLNYSITLLGNRNREFYSSSRGEYNESALDTQSPGASFKEEEDEDDLTDLMNGEDLEQTSPNNATPFQQHQHHTHRSNQPTISVKDDANLLLKRAIRNDLLSTVHNELLRQRNWCILTAAKLIAGEIAEEIENGFVWCALAIKRSCTGAVSNLSTDNYLNVMSDSHRAKTNSNHLPEQNPDSINNDLSSFSFANSSRLADELIAELQLACAELYLLKRRKLESAITILRVFERSLSSSTTNNKHLWTAKCSALTNLAYIHLLKGEITYAHRYLDQVLELDHMHVGTLVNKGCCFLLGGQLDQSREYFSEALLNEPNCIEAIYNLALANRQAGKLESSLDLLFRLNNLVAENEFCIYQIANIYEQLKDRDQALDWYEQLLSKVSSDPYLLNKMSDLFDTFMYLNDSYRQNPAFIPTLELQAIHYIETKVYEKAISYLKQASSIEPRKVKWHLMVAACYMRSNNYQQALAHYRLAHKLFPQNLDCLKHLFRLSEELGLLDEQIIYAEKIAKLEKANEQHERRVQSGDSGQHSASSTSSFNRHSSIYQSARLKNESATSSARRHPRPSSKFSLQSDEDSPDSRGNTSKDQRHSTSSKRSDTVNVDLSDALFGLDSNQDQRPMTSGRRHQTSEEQLANDFTNEDLVRFLP